MSRGEEFLRSLLGWLLFGLVLVVVGGFRGGWHVHDVMGWLTMLADGVGVFARLGLEHPTGTLVVAGIVVVLLVVPRLVALLQNRRQPEKDPQRMYTDAQREECFRRAGNRCEMEGFWLTRCHRPSQHADHWFPHTLGGRTDLDNAVAACQRCNTSKGAKVPTFWQTWRLNWRRRHYYDGMSAL